MPHKLDIDYLNQLKEERNLTMQEIADISGVALGSIKRILAGSTENPSASNIADIIDALGGSMDDAFGIRMTDSTRHNTHTERDCSEAFEEALKSSRSSYQNAYDSIRKAYEEQIAILKAIVHDKNQWIRYMFIYSVILTIVFATLEVLR